MFSYIRLKNFTSYEDIEFDFHKTASTYKNYVAIYGENGSGKTNFICSLYFLLFSMNSILMLIRNFM